MKKHYDVYPKYAAESCLRHGTKRMISGLVD
jgi:hypothetical protein